MSDIKLDYFERPLSAQETEALAAELNASDEACLAFAQAAEAEYQATGFPTPQLPARMHRRGLAILGALMIGGAGAAWMMHDSATPIVAVDTQATALPLTDMEAPVMPAHKAPIAVAPDRLNVQRFGEDFVLTVTTDMAGPARLSLQGLDGRELRQLYKGGMEKGQWAFRWDGAGADGQALVPGRYRLVLKRGSGRELGKLVQVEAR